MNFPLDAAPIKIIIKKIFPIIPLGAKFADIIIPHAIEITIPMLYILYKFHILLIKHMRNNIPKIAQYPII